MLVTAPVLAGPVLPVWYRGDSGLVLAEEVGTGAGVVVSAGAGRLHTTHRGVGDKKIFRKSRPECTNIYYCALIEQIKS